LLWINLILQSGKWGADLEVREISLAIDTPHGVVLIVGCGHPTIQKIIEQTKATTNKPIHLLLGGMHLLPAKDDQIKEIATYLRDDAKVDYIVPAHCTGEPAFVILKEVFGGKDIYAGLGATVVAGREVTAEAEAGQQVKYAMDTDDYRSYRAALAGGYYRSLLGPRSRLAN
jgi:7,8-dihydropterin-6-yl-methyl-4-(beta-D-ribofuranosyl)aminobenzene 5'-phosphate synthase